LVDFDEAMQLPGEEKHYRLLDLQKSLESDMNFLGVTGIEESIQENAKDTIQALKTAGIKIWMFTGDRVENGTSVALTCGLMRQQHHIFFITNDTNKKTIQDKIGVY
jgi:phospholipid-translocating ATPase